MHELKDREIFATGTWNGIEFDENDLDEIVENFNKLKDTHKVPLKFGHREEKKGEPAIGWVSNVYRKGNKLLADFSNVPKIVYEAIKNKLYRTVSIELLFNVKRETKERFNQVLDAVALLGADQPAVSTLSDLDALLATRTNLVGGHRLAFETIAGERQSIQSTGGSEMDEKAVQKIVDAALAPLKAANDDLTKELAKSRETIANFEAEKATRDKRAKEEAVKSARATVTAALDEAVKSQALTPAAREVYEKQIGLDDDSRVVSIDVEEIKAMFSAKDKKHPEGKSGSTEDDLSGLTPDQKLLRLTRDYQAKHGEKSFNVAFNRVAEANPKLHAEYLDSNGEE